jgi:ATP-dependent RNA helicase DDX55/SPB4
MIHGKMKQKKRNKIFDSFMKKNCGILISTDLIARGLDFLDVHYILQIDPPQVIIF